METKPERKRRGCLLKGKEGFRNLRMKLDVLPEKEGGKSAATKHRFHKREVKLTPRHSERKKGLLAWEKARKERRATGNNQRGLLARLSSRKRDKNRYAARIG